MSPYFSEDGSLVESEDFKYPEDLSEDVTDPGAEQLRLTKREAVLGLLRLLCDRKASPTRIGQRAVLLLYTLNRGDFKTKAEAGRRLGVSRQRIGQLLDLLNRDFPAIKAIL